MSTDTATGANLRIGDRDIELPVVTGTEGDDALDISALRAETGLITFDPGLWQHRRLLERDHLPRRGERHPPLSRLPDRAARGALHLPGGGVSPHLGRAADARAARSVRRPRSSHHTLIREEMRHFFDSFPADAHPMAVLASGTVGMSTFYPDSQNIFDPDAVEVTINRLIAKLPTLAAWSFKKAIGQPYVYPRNDLGYSANLLHMMFAVPSEAYEVDPHVAEALDLLLILHADHEQNASTSTVRLVGSTHANLYASISAGISALWGPLHGGANEAVIETLERIAADGGGVQKWVDRAKDPNDSFRLAGFGHRVYKNFDPRAKIIKGAAERVLNATGADDRLFEVARELEEVALHDEYFVSRKLYPNVDFYSGLIYRAIGFPKNMFTNCFAIGRLPGWIAQWQEMLTSKETRLGRPRQVYVGPAARNYVSIEQR